MTVFMSAVTLRMTLFLFFFILQQSELEQSRAQLEELLLQRDTLLLQVQTVTIRRFCPNT